MKNNIIGKGSERQRNKNHKCSNKSMEKQIIYPLEFLKSITLQHPVSSAATVARQRHRYKYAGKIQEEAKKFIAANEKEILDLSDSILRLMDYEVNMLVPSKVEIDEFKQKLNRINKFTFTEDYMQYLDASNDLESKKLVFLPFIKDEINILNKYNDKFLEILNSKELWNSNDACIASYYRLYSDVLRAYYYKLSYEGKRAKIDDTLTHISYLIFFYQPVLLAYVRGKEINNKIITKRLSELRFTLKPTSVDFELLNNEFYKKTSNIPPVFE